MLGPSLSKILEQRCRAKGQGHGILDNGGSLLVASLLVSQCHIKAAMFLGLQICQADFVEAEEGKKLVIYKNMFAKPCPK